MALFDSRPLGDPLVRRVDPLSQILVGDDIGRYEASESGDSAAYLGRQGDLQVSRRLPAGSTDRVDK